MTFADLPLQFSNIKTLVVNGSSLKTIKNEIKDYNFKTALRSVV